MKSHYLHAAILALLSLGANAQDTAPSKAPAPSDAQRVKAEVDADLEMWHKAGMSFIASPMVVTSSLNTPEYARYQKMRNGPEYQDAVARHLKAQNGQ